MPHVHARQALVGLALYYLWQLVPLNLAKKTDEQDEPDPHRGLPPRSGLPQRVMSSHDLPYTGRLQYY